MPPPARSTDDHPPRDPDDHCGAGRHQHMRLDEGHGRRHLLPAHSGDQPSLPHGSPCQPARTALTAAIEPSTWPPKLYRICRDHLDHVHNADERSGGGLGQSTDGGQRSFRHSSHVANPPGGSPTGSLPSSSPGVGTSMLGGPLGRVPRLTWATSCVVLRPGVGRIRLRCSVSESLEIAHVDLRTPVGCSLAQSGAFVPRPEAVVDDDVGAEFEGAQADVDEPPFDHVLGRRVGFRGRREP